MLWTGSTLNQILYVITLLGFGVFFGWIMARRIKAILPGPKEIRWNNIPQRLWGVLIYVFFQKKMLKDPFIGIIHTLIFWGFCVLSIGSMNFLIQGIFPAFYIPFTHNGFFEATFDTFTVLVIAAILAAFYRRLIIRPKRVLASFDALLILMLILTLMVSDLFSDAALAVFSSHSTAGAWASTLLAGSLHMQGWSLTALTTTHGIAWWLHGTTLLFFLCYLPFSKHFHVITAVPDVFFRTLRPWGKMTKLDIENSESFGAEKLSHLHWKNKLDGYSCTECGRCTAACPAYATGKKLDPRAIIMSIRDHVEHKDHDLSLHENTITAQELWACTTCAGCLDACPILIEHVPIITDMRRHLVLMEGAMPAEAANALRNIETQENPWGLSPETREAWIQTARETGITVPKMERGKPVDVLFWIGCAGSLDERNKKIVLNMCKILNHAGISFGVLGKEEACTGDSARRLGNEYLFQTLAQKNTATLNAYQYEKMITICPHCFNTFKNEYPDFGLQDKPILHHAVYLKSLFAQGKIKLKQYEQAQKVTLHDSCYLTRYNDVVDEPRAVISQLPGTEFVEMGRKKKNNFCCGAGGGRMWMEEHEGTPVNLNRAQEAVDTQADALLTECPFCMTMMEDGTKTIAAKTETPKLPVYDIAEWLAQNLA